MDSKMKRIQIIDALRGLAVVLMVVHHLLYNLVFFLGAPETLFTNPVFDALHYFFAGLFVFISGISSRFSRGNIKRGLITFAIAMGVTIVTYLMEMPIWFGVLHMLGISMLFFGLTKRLWDKIPKKLIPAMLIKLAVSLVIGLQLNLVIENVILGNLLSVLGWPQPGFVSYDYFPVFPWILVFLFGTWVGTYIADRKFPEWFYEAQVPLFPVLGRKALLIYVLHQPVLYVLVRGIGYLILR